MYYPCQYCFKTGEERKKCCENSKNTYASGNAGTYACDIRFGCVKLTNEMVRIFKVKENPFPPVIYNR